jgi:hypothetical protein
MAEHLGWQTLFINTGDHEATGEYGSDWVLITNNQALLDENALADEDTEWDDPRAQPLLWTDDFSSLWKALKKER